MLIMSAFEIDILKLLVRLWSNFQILVGKTGIFYDEKVSTIGWPPYWRTGRLADNRKTRNLTDNLSKISNKAYSKAVIGQFGSFPL